MSIRKDLDNGKFVFPKGFDNGIRLKDVLESQVDERYYLKDDKVKEFIESLPIKQFLDNDLPELNQVGYINHYNGDANRVYSSNNIARTLKSEAGGGGAKTGWYTVPDYSYCIDSNYHKGISLESYVKKHKRQLIVNDDDMHHIRIRRLTPKECFRLMGFSDESFEVANKVVSNTQLYKQAGNSIVVDVLYYIFVELYKAMPYLFNDLKLGSFFSGIGAFECALDRLYESINSGNFTYPINGDNNKSVYGNNKSINTEMYYRVNATDSLAVDVSRERERERERISS